jgi:hypothetical protein
VAVATSAYPPIPVEPLQRNERSKWAMNRLMHRSMQCSYLAVSSATGYTQKNCLSRRSRRNSRRFFIKRQRVPRRASLPAPAKQTQRAEAGGQEWSSRRKRR